MEDTTKLPAAVVDLLHMINNPPKVEQPETVIKHAMLACMKSYGPTMAMLEGLNQQQRLAQLAVIAAEYIERHCPGGLIDYDEASCDGYCLAEDLRLANGPLESSDE